jgi:hypothetical protein
MSPVNFLTVTAVAEVGTGLLLLVLPSVPLALLLGIGPASPEAIFVARIAGVALLAVGVASGVGRKSNRNPAQLGLLIGVLIYDAAAAGLLIYAGLFLNMAGLALWPAVVLHSALAVWCVLCLRAEPRGESTGTGHGIACGERHEFDGH